MLKDQQVTFIGGGVMAEAIIKGLLGKQLIQANRVFIAEPRQERAEELARMHGVSAQGENAAAVKGATIVILSVKPQAVPHVLADLKGRIPKEALVLSIIAGVRMQTLMEGLDHKQVVRSMPNTPAQIGEGMTVWAASHAVSDKQREQACAVLGALGVEVFVEEEDYLDMATAISGTGPAYAFLFMEALVDAGVHLGFPRYLAEQLVLQTMKGSVDYAMHTSQHLARLRNQVTSPGGTTAEAMYYLDKAGFRTALSRAVWAAYQRSIQLGKGKKRSEIDDGKE